MVEVLGSKLTHLFFLLQSPEVLHQILVLVCLYSEATPFGILSYLSVKHGLSDSRV